MELVIDDVPFFDYFRCASVTQWMCEDGISIIAVTHHDVVIAPGGLDREASSEVLIGS